MRSIQEFFKNFRSAVFINNVLGSKPEETAKEGHEYQDL